METKELKKVNKDLKKIFKQINSTANRVNKGLVIEFKDGSKWIEFNHFNYDDSRIIYNLEKYEEYLLDTTIDITSVPTLSPNEFYHKRWNVGISKEYCVEPKL
jgi:hypothetical protein